MVRGQKVGSHYHISIYSMNFFYEWTVVFRRTTAVWILYQCTEIGFVKRCSCVVSIYQFYTDRRTLVTSSDLVCSNTLLSTKTSENWSFQICFYGETASTSLQLQRWLHQKACIRQFQPGGSQNHCLEIKQAFEATLWYLCLVRRVLCVPSRVFKIFLRITLGCDRVCNSPARYKIEYFVFFLKRSFSGRRYSNSLCGAGNLSGFSTW